MAKGYNSLLERRIKDKQRKNYYTIKTSILTNGLALLLLQYATEIGSMARDYIPI